MNFDTLRRIWRSLFVCRSSRRGAAADRPASAEQLELRTLLTPVVGVVQDVGPWNDSLRLLPTSTRLFFVTDPFGDSPDALWVTDGTPAGTIKLREMHTIADWFFTGTANYAEFQGELYFSVSGFAGDPDIGLWKSDGTPQGTVQVAPLQGPPQDLVVLHDKLYFYGVDAAHGWELWSSDGTAAGTGMVVDLLPGPHSGIESIRATTKALLNGKLYFAAQSARHNMELWASDGTAAGTVLVRDIFPGSFIRPFDGAKISDSNITGLRVVNGTLVFTAADRTNPDDLFEHTLWLSDGTSAGTVKLKELDGPVPGTTAAWIASPEFLGEYNGLLYFAPHTDDPHSDWELWATDGTRAGTRFLKSVQPDVVQGGIVALAGSNGRVYFNGSGTPFGDYEPWITDGTPEGTRRLKDIVPGTDSSRPSHFFPFGDAHTVFRGNDGKKGAELWITDGTTDGTYRLTDLAPGRKSSFPEPFAQVAQGLLFFAIDPERTVLYLLSPGPPSEPVIAPQSFELPENSAWGQTAGTVAAIAPGKQAITFSITAGDPQGAWAIDPRTGRIHVANPAALDFETTPTFFLIVRAATASGASASAVVTIRLTDRPDLVRVELDDAPLAISAAAAGIPVDPLAALIWNAPAPPSLAGAELVVNVARGGQKKDRLGVAESAVPGGLAVKGKKILRGTTVVAVWSGGKNDQPLRVRFLQGAALDDLIAALRQVVFSSRDSAGERWITAQLTGIDGGPSDADGRGVEWGP